MKPATRKTFGAKRSAAAAKPVQELQPTPAKGVAPSREGRHAPRKALRSMAVLKADDSRSVIFCIVLDISATGAKLRVELVDTQLFEPAMELPKTFKMVLPNDRIEIDCELAWQREHDIGVEFVSTFRPAQAEARKTA